MKNCKNCPRNINGAVKIIILLAVILIIILCYLIYMMNMPGKSYSGPFRPLSENEQSLCNLLREHVLMLAEEIGERNIWHYTELETLLHWAVASFRGHRAFPSEGLAEVQYQGA